MTGLDLRVAVLGAGLMGRGIAQVFLTAGADVAVWDPDEANLGAVNDRIRAQLRAVGDAPLARESVLCDSAEAAVGDVDLVLEAVPEDLAIKRELFGRAARVNANAILATNTSVLRVTEIAEAIDDKHRLVGTHWWNPPYLIDIVEVVRGERTADETVARVSAIHESVGKVPVEVRKDVPGFVGNRMQFALVREAASLVENGVCSAETVDLVARHTFGRRWAAVGPLENSDYIGLDLVAAILDYVGPSLASDQRAPEIIREAVAEGRLGAKAGRGFYDWPAGRREDTEQRLVSHLLNSRTAG